MLIADEADKLLMIPGPTPVQREILAALAVPTISHTSKTIAEIIERSLAGLRAVAATEGAKAFVFGGAGTLAQEAAVVNLVAPGERLVVVSNGYFGDRFVPIAQAYGIEVERLAAPWGTSITGRKLQDVLEQRPARAVTLTQVETSTGVQAPVDELAEVARAAGSLVIVDAVCAFGGVPTAMDERHLDVVLTGAQKALGVPPGLAILLLSPEAWTRRQEREGIPAYYADLANWEVSMADPTVYFSTHAVNLFYALERALQLIAQEGLVERYARHVRLADTFRVGMRDLGFASLTHSECLAPTLSVLAYPEGVDDGAFRTALADRGVIAAGCLGDFKGRGVRFGHMGNITETEILQTLNAVDQTLRSLGHR